MADIVGGALVERVVQLYTIGLGGFQPQRILHVGSFDMMAGTAIPGLSGGPPTGGSGRNDTGVTPPSLRMRGLATFGPIYWPVTFGVRTIDIRCYYTPEDGEAYRPQLIVRANTQLGVPIDYAVTAPSTADTWHVTTVLALSITGTGVLEVYLKTRNSRPDGAGSAGSGSPPVYTDWDRIRTT